MTFLLLVCATALNGVAAGASLDQAIKQLLARHRVGVVAYSEYSKVADLGKWHSLVCQRWDWGGGADSCDRIAAASEALPQEKTLPIYGAVVLSILHSLVTTQAAPTMFSQRRHDHAEAALMRVFNRFARLHALRALFQVLTFASLLWAVVSYGR